MSDTPKTMQEEMNDEWAELAMENIEKLIPAEWNNTIQEVILPKILYFIKMALKKGIKDSHNILGQDKYMVACNLPVEIKPNEVIWVPHIVKIDKNQLANEFALKEGETPEAMISYLDVYARIDSYKTVKDIMADIKSGNIFKGLVTGTDMAEEAMPEGTVKKIEAPGSSPNSEPPTPNP